MANKSKRPVRKLLGGSLLGNDWEQKTRAKIQASQITNRLIGYVNGNISLEPAQVSAGLGLLRKVLPDLSQSDNKHQISGKLQIGWLPSVE